MPIVICSVGRKEVQSILRSMGPSGVEEFPQQHTLPGGKEANERSHSLTRGSLGSTDLPCVPANGKRKKRLTVSLQFSPRDKLQSGQRNIKKTQECAGLENE